VAYPHPSDVSAKFTRSLVHLLVWDAKHHRRIIDGGAHLPVASGAVVARGRNQIVREFLKLDGIDWLLQLDTDMVFDGDLVDRLVDAAHPTLRPVVGGLCFSYMADRQRKVWPTLYAMVPGDERFRRLTKYPSDALVKVAGTGAACLLVHRSVLEAMAVKYPPPRPWFDETKFYAKDAEGNTLWETGDELSEDLTFCLRAEAAGFDVYVHTGIRLGHEKPVEINEQAFLVESAVLAEACVPALPTYVVIASKNRPEMLANLRGQLAGQTTEVFVFDNGYDTPPRGAIPAHGWGLHQMWNRGLEMAAEAAQGPHNVLILNDDVEVPNEFAAHLEAGLRVHEDHWISYPNWRELEVPPGEAVRTASDTMAGQTMSGWAFMVRGEAGLRFDERFSWWYGDSDLECQVKAAGKFTVCVGGCFARHLDPLRSTLEDSDRLADAELDEKLFAAKWNIDPASLWLAQRGAA
jgi:GT2 family glycosyltransferase